MRVQGTEWFETHCYVLRHDFTGIGKVIDVLYHRLRKRAHKAGLQRELGFFMKNRRHMNYKDAADVYDPIGSGTVEAVNKTSVNTRMKRSEQRWGRDGVRVS